MEMSFWRMVDRNLLTWCRASMRTAGWVAIVHATRSEQLKILD